MARHPAIAQAIRQAVGYPAPKGAITALAVAAGVEVPTASRWASGQMSPGPEHWPALERHLGLQPGDLAALLDEPVAHGSVTRAEFEALVARVAALESSAAPARRLRAARSGDTPGGKVGKKYPRPSPEAEGGEPADG